MIVSKLETHEELRTLAASLVCDIEDKDLREREYKRAYEAIVGAYSLGFAVASTYRAARRIERVEAERDEL